MTDILSDISGKIYNKLFSDPFEVLSKDYNLETSKGLFRKNRYEIAFSTFKLFIYFFPEGQNTNTIYTVFKTKFKTKNDFKFSIRKRNFINCYIRNPRLKKIFIEKSDNVYVFKTNNDKIIDSIFTELIIEKIISMKMTSFCLKNDKSVSDDGSLINHQSLVLKKTGMVNKPKTILSMVELVASLTEILLEKNLIVKFEILNMPNKS